ncbi:hypothetical protein [Arthrobacter pascens]|uniref:hypothetical protein n=1 Tax=Arthrobacter pascens TaxID=1677 RepID=UPI00196A5B5B|nr:hypothetical protein [Arthrobacter pascens]MBN3497297.1 hypothetical protein [Arthrobacter pascens]
MRSHPEFVRGFPDAAAQPLQRPDRCHRKKEAHETRYSGQQQQDCEDRNGWQEQDDYGNYCDKVGERKTNDRRLIHLESHQ